MTAVPRRLGIPSPIDASMPDRGFELLVSAEPGVVIASLVDQSTPEWCDACTVDVVDGAARYRLASGALPTRHSFTGEPSGHTLRVPFLAPAHSDPMLPDEFRHGGTDRVGEAGRAAPRDHVHEPFHGTATFSWFARSPSPHERMTAALLVEHALRTVEAQRAEDAARIARAQAENLTTALHNSRRIGAAIGILMLSHKITQEQAFALLRAVSQRTHRKVCAIADDVVDTGCLDDVLEAGTPLNRGGAG